MLIFIGGSRCSQVLISAHRQAWIQGGVKGGDHPPRIF